MRIVAVLALCALGANPQPADVVQESDRQIDELLVAAHEQSSQRAAFYRDLVDRTVWVLGQSKEDSGKKAKWQFFFYEQDGRRLIPFFSSEDRMRRTNTQNLPQMTLTGRRFLEAVPPGVSAVLNPDSPIGKELSPDEIRNILSGRLLDRPEPWTLEDGQALHIQVPDPFPDRLVDRLSLCFRSNPTVTRAFLARARDLEAGQPPHWVVGVELDTVSSSSLAQVAQEAGLAIRSVLRNGEYADFVQVGGESSSIKPTPPMQIIYER